MGDRPADKEYLSPADAASLLGWSQVTVMRHLRSGTLPGRKVGRLWVIRRVDLDAALASPPPEPPSPKQKPRR